MPNNNTQQTAYLQSGDPRTENLDPTLYAGQLGIHLTIVDPETGQACEFQRVRVDSVMDVAPSEGAVAWWLNAAGGYVVTTDVSVAGRGNVAGVFNNAPDLGNDTFIQLEGPTDVLGVDSPTAAFSAAGLIVIPSGTDAKADCLAAGTAASYPQLGVSAGAQDGTTKLAAVNLNVANRRP